MIFGIEIALSIYGLYALIAGKYSLGKGKVVEGQPARIAGLFLVLTIPVAFVIGIIWGFLGIDTTLIFIVDVVAIIVCAVLSFWYANKNLPAAGA